MMDFRFTVFLDRDGTINVNFPMPNVNTPERLFLLDGAADGIRILNDLGARVIVLTNQAGIENPENDLSIETMGLITERLNDMIYKDAGARIDDTFYCPHLASSNCNCRKPAPGLVHQAMYKYPDIKLENAFIVGDRPDDILLGRELNIYSILVLTGHGAETSQQLHEASEIPTQIAKDLHAAALSIKNLVN